MKFIPYVLTSYINRTHTFELLYLVVFEILIPKVRHVFIESPDIISVCFIADQPSITSLSLNSDSNSSVVTVDELTAMTLRCDVDSNPRSTITLFNNSLTLMRVTNSKQAEFMWNVAGCLDTGYYTCQADNGIKLAVSQKVQLVVRCKFNRLHI